MTIEFVINLDTQVWLLTSSLTIYWILNISTYNNHVAIKITEDREGKDNRKLVCDPRTCKKAIWEGKSLHNSTTAHLQLSYGKENSSVLWFEMGPNQILKQILCIEKYINSLCWNWNGKPQSYFKVFEKGKLHWRTEKWTPVCWKWNVLSLCTNIGNLLMCKILGQQDQCTQVLSKILIFQYISMLKYLELLVIFYLVISQFLIAKPIHILHMWC